MAPVDEGKLHLLKHQADRLKRAVTKNSTNSRDTLARTPVTRGHTDKLGSSNNTKEFKRRNNNGPIYHHSNNSASKPGEEGHQVVRGMIRHIMRTNDF
jgi:hypothetical protein